MAEFIVTAPDGKEYVVNAPEGASQEQALEFAKSQFSSTTGGAAVGNPNLELGPRIEGPRVGGESLDKIGAATAFGGIIGAAAPELLMGAGRVLAPFPQTRVLAPILESSGRILKGQRGMSAASGAFGGAIGETAGQGAEAAGADPFTAEATRFVAGGVGPQVGGAVLWGLKNWVATPSLNWFSKMEKSWAKNVLAKMEGTPENVTAQEKAHLEKLATELRGGARDDAPLAEVGNAFQREGATAQRALSTQEANRIVSESEADARRIMSEAMKGPVARRQQALTELQQIGDNALLTAQGQRAKIGPDRELWETGGVLRDTIVQRNKAALDARKATLEKNKADRDAIVVAKQENPDVARRQVVNQLPEYERLVSSLKSEIRPGEHSPDVASDFNGILRAVVNPEKDIFGQAKPVSFQAIDDVRRNLGKVFEGDAPEGYKAISADIARRYYWMLSDIQKKFVGKNAAGINPQEKLLDDYAQGSEALAMFRSKRGAQATALDKFDEELFKTDASALPKKYFASKEGIDELTRLVGDRGAVVEAAKAFAANQMRDKSVAQVKSWLNSHPQMPPEVKFAVAEYLNTLEKGERIAANTTKGRQLIERSIGAMTGEAEREAGSIRTIAGRRADQAMAEGERRAATLEGNKFPVERAEQLIERGSPQEWALAVQAIRNKPSAANQMNNAVRQVMAKRAYSSSKDVADFFGRIRTNLETSNMLTSQQADDISAKLYEIQNMRLPEKSRLGLAKRVLLQSVGSYASTVAGRTTAATFGALGNMSQFVPQ